MKEYKEDNQIWEFVKRCTVGPLGRGLTQQEAAKEMNISERTVYDIKQRFKKKYPIAYDKFININESAKKHGDQLRWKKRREYPNGYYGYGASYVGSDLYDIDDRYGEQIKEVK